MQQGLRSAEGQALFSTLPGSVTAGGQATDTLATTYHRAKSFIMKSGEKAVVGSHVIYSCASSAGSDNAGNSGKEYESVKSVGILCLSRTESSHSTFQIRLDELSRFVSPMTARGLHPGLWLKEWVFWALATPFLTSLAWSSLVSKKPLFQM